MDVRTFIEEMELLAPPDLAEDFDVGRIGLIVEGSPDIRNVCCALDATPGVVKQAVGLGADMLIVHHTPIWTPLTAMTGSMADLMREVLSARLNIYVMHTNFDRAEEGVNDALAEVLMLSNVSPLSLGRIGTCTLTLPEISRLLGGNIRIWGSLAAPKRLALVAGSGFDPLIMQEAKRAGADAFLSAEMKHSTARSAPLPCIEATHYSLEAPAMKRLALRRGWQYLDDPPVLLTIP